jgi:hypothetical protein
MQNQNLNAMNVPQAGVPMQHLQPGFDAPQMVVNPLVYVTPSPSPSPMFVPMNTGHSTFAYGQPLQQIYTNPTNDSRAIPKPKEFWRRQSSTCRKVMSEKIENIDITDLAYDQKRNRYLQQRISKLKAEGNLVELRYMFHQLLPDAIQLAVDPYGNFVLQRLLKCIGPDLLEVLIQHLKPDLTRLAKDEYACRILQVILTHVSANGRETLLKTFLPELEELLQNEYGSFVIQKIVETMDPCDLSDLMEIVIPNMYRLARHKAGTRVIQELFQQLDPSQKGDMEQELLAEVAELSMHSTGQYAVIKMIQYGLPDVRKQIAELVKDNLEEIGHTQPGCKVLEKLLLKLRRSDLHILLDPMRKGNTMEALAKCPYGNFVVQQALESDPRGETMKKVEAIFANRAIHELNRFERHVFKCMQNFTR